MPLYAKQSTPYPLIVAVINTDGDYITGLTVTFEVRKSSDNSLIDSGTLIGVGDIYVDTINISILDNYYVLYITPSGYENGEEELIVQANTLDDIDNELEDILDILIKILGLSQSNYRITNQEYSTEGCLTSAVISIYNNATDTENEDNPIAQYQVTAIYNMVGQLIDYKVVEI